MWPMTVRCFVPTHEPNDSGMTRGAPRILIAKLGLDGHDRALRMLAFELRERGVEVIVLGTGTSPKQIASVAAEEDVAAIGLSLLSGAHLSLVPKVLHELEEAENPIPVVCGGVIPLKDAERLQQDGVTAVASVGTSVGGAVDLILSAADGGLAS